MKIYNSATRSLEDFAPLDDRHVRMYTCGPTVYDYAHIGNLRTFLFEDILRRHLEFSGYRVTQVMNLTDVDDKTIRGAREAGRPLREHTQKFKDAFFEDLRALTIEPAEHYPAATDHVPAMLDLIGRLIARGLAYVAEDGSVYFSVAKDPGYGRLVNIDRENMRPGARVDHDEYEKEVIADFALWKAWREEDGDVAWDSPWGRGRPGWHIECSAMSMQYLGETFDLHTGGVDNRFPHHEDEIAQSEGATGKTFVKYWMHSNFLLVDNRKMSKSLGNFYTLRDLVQRGCSPRAIRYALMSAHYRQLLNFTLAGVDQAGASLARLDEFQARLRGRAATAAAGTAPAWAAEARTAFVAALDDDLNMPAALAAVFRIVHDGNAALDAGRLSAADAAAVLALLRDLDRVLGVLEHAQEQAGADVMLLVEQRAAARTARDWAKADELRKQLESLGWIVKDTAEGPKLRRAGA